MATDPSDMRELMRRSLESMERIQSSLDALSGGALTAPMAPATSAAGVEHQATVEPQRSNFLSPEERMFMRQELRKRSDEELMLIFNQQARKRDVGVPFEGWLAMGGSPLAAAYEMMQRNELAPEVVKLLDTTGGSALIRTDLEPVLYELFVRQFPAYERFPKEPANGLVHTWNQQTTFGDAVFMSELGTVTDDTSAYQRQNTNVAICATRRGISLKSQFATLQSGSGFNPQQTELQGGLLAVAHKIQKTIFGGQSTDSGGDVDNELGAYDANGFTGMRSILNTGRAKDIQMTGATVSNWDDARRGVNQACVEIMNAVTSQGPVMAYLNATVKEMIDAQQDKNVRYTGTLTNVGVGVNTNSLNTVFGPVPLFPIPGDSIGLYDAASAGGKDVYDIYLVDERFWSLPYLGSPGPTVLDIPIGISGQLTHLFIIFLMHGLACKAPVFSNKVRVRVEA